MTERLVGRHGERARLEELLRRAGDGVGAIVLLGGEAGVGKTRLAAEVAAGADALVLRGSATQGATAPYGPLVAALRSRLRAQPDALAGAGPLRAELALLLPELGDRAAAADRPTLFEALRAAFAHVAAERHGARPARRPPVVRRGDARGALPRSPCRCASCRCSCSPRTGPTGCRAGTGSGACATTCAARATSTSSCSARSDRRTRRRCWRRRSARRRTRRSHARSTSGPRGSRSSPRSWPPRCG